MKIKVLIWYTRSTEDTVTPTLPEERIYSLDTSESYNEKSSEDRHIEIFGLLDNAISEDETLVHKKNLTWQY